MYLKKDYKNAKKYLLKALKLIDDLHINCFYADIYELLSKNESMNKNYKSALTYQKLFSEKIQEQYTSNTENKISMLLSDFKYKQSEQEKEIFRLRNIELKAAKENAEKANEVITKKTRTFWIVSDMQSGYKDPCYLIAKLLIP